jgi:ferredoxin-NADP reductase
MRLVVRSKRALTHNVVRLRLENPQGGVLPSFEAGAHLDLAFGGMKRSYSITSPPDQATHYEIAVLRTERGQGGSAFIHDRLAIGDEVLADGPFNTFGLMGRPRHVVFIAGGIGITPFFTLTRACIRAGATFELHYVARTRADHLPLQVPEASAVFKYTSREPAVPGRRTRVLDIRAVLERTQAGAHVYACGPQRMLDAVRSIAHQLGWSGHRVHVEGFGPVHNTGDRPLQVQLALSGISLRVEPGTSILQAMLDNGVWANYACRRGECGSCYVEVSQGDVEHRDVCLSDAQRQAGMCPCVSWSTSDRLTLQG